MVSIRYGSYYKHSEFFLYNQKHNQHVRSAYFVQFSGCVWKDYIICHMWVNHDPETTSRSFVFFFYIIHYAVCLMSRMMLLLTFGLQYLSQCLVLGWYSANICWMNVCFILLYPAVIYEWFLWFYPGWWCFLCQCHFLYAHICFISHHIKKISLSLSFIVLKIAVFSIIYIWLRSRKIPFYAFFFQEGKQWVVRFQSHS